MSEENVCVWKSVLYNHSISKFGDLIELAETEHAGYSVMVKHGQVLKVNTLITEYVGTVVSEKLVPGDDEYVFILDPNSSPRYDQSTISSIIVRNAK